MPRIQYKSFNFRQATKSIIHAANDIITEWLAQGYDLTLRQLFYQFVSKDLLPNTQRSYKNLGNIINDARLAGMIDWNHIVDRTRNMQENAHWSDPASIVDAAARGYAIDKWQGQPYRIEAWIEKEALVQVLYTICSELDIPHFACRGYVSQSEMWRAAQRLIDWEDDGYETIVLHLGDHDPSGIDMTRDIQDRLWLFRSQVEVKRIALNMDQIEELNPPPNPAKTSDARFASYVQEYGDESWELDALPPSYISDLVKEHVLELRDEKKWDEMCDREEKERGLLDDASEEIKVKLEESEEDEDDEE
jgi:hypothetical protein